MQQKELNALISLLDEPSDLMFEQIRDKILFYGIEAIPLLENAWDSSFNNTIQERIEGIIHVIQQENLKKELQNWIQNNSTDLLSGFLLATQYQYPDQDKQKIKDKISEIQRSIWLELNENLTALEKIKVINHIVFEVFGYHGNKSNIDTPRNLFLNDLMETGKGNHLSLGMLLIILSHNLGIPVFGIDLPQHFILAYTEGNKNSDILFYINPFNKGAVFTRKEIDLFIKYLKLKPEKKHFQPCDNITILKRLFSSLLIAYKKMGYTDKVEELNELVEVFNTTPSKT
jgi:regulator of sirC expression with transglutaminase-like and TPR domain